MKLLQIGFLVVLGTLCFATYATSKTLQAPQVGLVQEQTVPAPDLSSPERG
ncbi:hypothetical protein [Loktanella sp. 5RATIMAR09]|uniref:hypothetical protein n=1 Tax=Loktanella sp. 5RATIMAR09 TaxID=1225655 RepID=UPI0012EE7AF2|nr:hypothetical protein [Loktanella sp. 5RATIMAR09]